MRGRAFVCLPARARRHKQQQLEQRLRSNVHETSAAVHLSTQEVEY